MNGTTASKVSRETRLFSVEYAAGRPTKNTQKQVVEKDAGIHRAPEGAVEGRNDIESE
jgi:hypothetical protein